MKKDVFPDDKAFPLFAEALQELVCATKVHTYKIGKVSKKGDLQIFCHLMTGVFINVAHEYIETYRQEKNDPPEEGVKCYKELVKILHDGLTSDSISRIFKYPIADWEFKAVEI